MFRFIVKSTEKKIKRSSTRLKRSNNDSTRNSHPAAKHGTAILKGKVTTG